ncbi:MAG TPA: glycosyltransferase, partial [Candidatus Sulfotelmatobacter sp.]|nr:glycosyltransferase [Candidatus Sulfotelmatobacter sp.]
RLYRVAPEKVTVIHNGVDLEEYRPVADCSALRRYGIDLTRPYVLFVGRISRQKGILHLLHALPRLDPGAQLVLCASSPDTPELERELAEAVGHAQATRRGVIWIREMVSPSEAVQLYSHAAVFCCPSIYEPFGIINLEAMACQAPVVASAVGGIPEVVRDGETGLLVPVAQAAEGVFEPRDPEAFAQALSSAINLLLRDPERRVAMGRAGRRRTEAEFAWAVIADRVLALYESLRQTAQSEGGHAD